MLALQTPSAGVSSAAVAVCLMLASAATILAGSAPQLVGPPVAHHWGWWGALSHHAGVRHQGLGQGWAQGSPQAELGELDRAGG